MAALDLIDEYSAWQRSESRSPQTIADRRNILMRMDRELPGGLDGASEDHLRLWLWRDRTGETKTGRDWTLATRENYHGAFTDFYQWAKNNRVFGFNPAAGISRPIPPDRLPDPVTDEELAYALAHARQPWLLCIQLAAYAGCRCIDIDHLTRERVTAEGTHIAESKGGNARVVPTHPLIWDAVRDLPRGPLLGLDRRQISMSASAYFQRTLGLPGVRMHRFRHWFGTQIQRHYKDLLVTQQLMGHKDPKTTAGYALVVSESRAAAVAMLPTFAAGPLADWTPNGRSRSTSAR